MQSSVNYAAITPVVTIDAGQTTCEDLSTFIEGGDQEYQDYPNSLAINGNLDDAADDWAPFGGALKPSRLSLKKPREVRRKGPVATRTRRVHFQTD
jgi:hypothetical protein